MSGEGGWLTLRDAEGRSLASTGPPGIAGAAEGFEEATATTLAGRTFVSNLLPHRERVGRMVRVVVPVMVHGRLKYTVSHVMAPSNFGGTLTAARFSPETIMTVIDRTGTIVARHPAASCSRGRKQRSTL